MVYKTQIRVQIAMRWKQNDSIRILNHYNLSIIIQYQAIRYTSQKLDFRVLKTWV